MYNFSMDSCYKCVIWEKEKHVYGSSQDLEKD